MLVCLYKPEEGLSQNNNEALTHLVWDIGPKEKFAGPETVETACPLAVCLINGGAKTLQSVLKWLHLETGEHCRSLVSPPLTSKDYMLQDRRLWMQQRFAAKFAVASERVEMNKMKSETAQPMSLEHLDPEFLF